MVVVRIETIELAEPVFSGVLAYRHDLASPAAIAGLEG